MHRSAPLLLSAALLVPSPAVAQALPDPDARALARAVQEAVTADELMAHAREITRHERPSGSPGENAAIDYIVAELEAAGVPVQVHTFRGFTSDPVEATVSVPGSDTSPRAITVSFSADGAVEAPLVDAGGLGDLPDLEPGTGERLVREGTPARPGRSAERPDGLPDVRGRVVLVDGQPRGAPVAVLERLGAAAVVFANPEERLNDLIVTTTWGTPSLANYHRLPGIPVAEVTRSGGEALREHLARRGGTTVRVETEVRTGWTPLRLAVARIEAPDPEAGLVLFGGHIDGWYHGGTDEGASNAAMLALARAFHANRDRLRRDLVVAWWPGHSNARYGGSTWFADHAFDELRRRGVAHVNVDGIGQRGAKRFSASASPALRGLALDVLRGGAGQEARAFLPGRNSDQSFNGAGLPLLQLNHTRLAEDGGYWWWHTPDDTYDKISPEVLEQDADLYAEALARLLAEPRLPVDPGAEVAALAGHLAERREDMGAGAGAVDLGEAERLVERLADRVAVLEARLASADPGPGLDAALLDVIRPLHRAVFVPASPHHPDGGMGWVPLAGLAAAPVLSEADPESDRFGFARTTLVRERNRLVEALDASLGAAERLIHRLEGGR